jgi:hypothetical protein
MVTLLILDLGTRWDEWSSSRPGRTLPPAKGPSLPIVQEDGWAPEAVWTQRLEEKSFRLCRGSKPGWRWSMYYNNNWFHCDIYGEKLQGSCTDNGHFMWYLHNEQPCTQQYFIISTPTTPHSLDSNQSRWLLTLVSCPWMSLQPRNVALLPSKERRAGHANEVSATRIRVLYFHESLSLTRWNISDAIRDISLSRCISDWSRQTNIYSIRDLQF